MKRTAVVTLTLVAMGCSEPTAVRPVSIIAGWLTFEGPGVVRAGDAITVRVQSYSRGRVRQWPVRVYLSTDASITANDLPLADLTATPLVLDTVGSAALTDGLAIVPAGTPPGVYYLGVILDPDKILPDTDRSDNAISGVIPIGVDVAASGVTGAPTPVAPPDRAEFNLFPRLIGLDWSDVGGALTYEVEVDYCFPWTEPDWWNTCLRWFVWTDFVVTSSAWTTDFVGAQPGRWRVRGLDARGIAGPPSPWQLFKSLQ